MKVNIFNVKYKSESGDQEMTAYITEYELQKEKYDNYDENESKLIAVEEFVDRWSPEKLVEIVDVNKEKEIEINADNEILQKIADD